MLGKPQRKKGDLVWVMDKGLTLHETEIKRENGAIWVLTGETAGWDMVWGYKYEAKSLATGYIHYWFSRNIRKPRKKTS